MYDHGDKVFSNSIHEQRGIDRVNVEAAFYKIEQFDVIGHWHAVCPVYPECVRSEKVVVLD